MRITEGQYFLGLITVLTIWLFVGLPIIYQPHAAHSYQANHTGRADEQSNAPPVKDSAQQAKSGGHESSGEFWSAKLTDWLIAIFTIALFAATYALWRETNKLWQAGERQIAVAEKSADAALKSALVAERALNGTEAPFLIVDEMILHEESTKGFLSYVFRNCGRSPAIVMETYDGTILSSRLPQKIPFPPLQSNLHYVELIGPGGSVRNIIPHPPIDPTGEPWSGVEHPNLAMFVAGQIRYADVFGNQYLTGFCVAFNRHTERFYPIGGPGYNYRRQLSEDERLLAEARDML